MGDGISIDTDRSFVNTQLNQRHTKPYILFEQADGVSVRVYMASYDDVTVIWFQSSMKFQLQVSLTINRLSQDLFSDTISIAMVLKNSNET